MPTAISRPYPSLRLVTLTIANQYYELTLPANTSAAKVSFNPDNASLLAFESVAGTELSDGDTYAGPDLTTPLVASVYTESVRKPGDRLSYYLCSSSAGTIVSCIVEG